MSRMVRAAALLVLLPAAAGAQSGAIGGVVRDTGGAPIRGAVVGIPGTTLFTTTGADGRYRLAPVAAPAPGVVVRVRAAAIGFAPARAAVALAHGDSATADFALVPSPFELTPLDVVSTKVPRFGERPATSVAQVTERDLGRRAVNTVDEAIDRAPGVQLVNGQINIRGSTGYVQGLNSRVLLLVDGVPMNQGDRGGINWDLLPVDQIERVDILKGAGSSLYGSAALGGVVNLTTRDVPAGMHARVRVTGGAYSNPPHAVWRFRDGPGLQGGADVGLSYGTETAAGRVAFGARHTDGYREQDARDHWQIAAKGRWQASPTSRVDISGAWAVDDYDLPLSWCSRGECDDRGQVYQPFKVDTTELGAHTRSKKGYVAAQIRTVASARFAWQARASWLRTNFTDRRPSIGSDFSIANRLGAEIRAEAHPDSARTVLVGAEGTFSDVASDIFGTHTQSEIAAYGESEQRVGAVRLGAGARLDFLTVDGGSPSAVVSPRIGATLPLGDGTLRASVGRGFRAPTMAERFVHTFALGFEVVPNPSLRPETGWSVEIGHTTPVIAFARLDAAIFWTEARDLIEPTLVTSPAGPRIQLQNVARARIAGLDAAVLAAPIPGRLTATVGYTYLHARRLAAAGVPEQALAFRPTHLLTLGADYDLGAVDLGADFRYSSRPERIELEGFVDPRRVAVKVVDLRAGWQSGPVSVRLLVANVLNYIYNLVPETLAPVRTATVTAVWTY